MPGVGEIWSITLPYYDIATGKPDFKKRPVLVLAQADSGDFVVLPISTIKRSENIHTTYDIPVDPAKYALLNLNCSSYIRTHKQTFAHKAQFMRQICGNIKGLYEELYTVILTKREEFSTEITTQALQ